VVIGVPWRDCGVIGTLLGTRMVLNELVAFSMLRTDESGARSTLFHDRHIWRFVASRILAQSESRSAASERSRRTKRANWLKLGIRAMLAGTMANLMSASIAGMLL